MKYEVVVTVWSQLTPYAGTRNCPEMCSEHRWRWAAKLRVFHIHAFNQHVMPGRIYFAKWRPKLTIVRRMVA